MNRQLPCALRADERANDVAAGGRDPRRFGSAKADECAGRGRRLTTAFGQHCLLRAVAVAIAILPVLGCRSLPWNRARWNVTVFGIDDNAIERDLCALSQTWQYRFDAESGSLPPDSQVRADALKMSRYLQSKGYCGADVTAEVSVVKSVAQVRFRVANTDLYTIRDVEIETNGIPSAAPAGWTNTLTGRTVDFGLINSEGRKLIAAIQDAGYVDAAMVDRSVVLDRTAHQADVRYRLNTGQPAVFGAWSVKGLRHVERRFVERRLTWETGDPYRQSNVDTFSRRLSESGLFSYVDVSGSRANPTSEVYDVSVGLTERKRRTIALGVGYQSDLGPQATVLWQHRNLLGLGQRFELDAKYSQDLWLGSAVLTLPDIWGTRHALDMGIEAADEDSDAYRVRHGLVFARVMQYVGRRSTLHYGPALRRSLAEQLGRDNNYLQASFPVVFLLNRRDDALDPTRGFAVVGRVEPTHDLEHRDRYVKTTLTPTAYVPMLDGDLVFGARLTLGSIAGVDRDGVPADLRFYAGGAQSIRGYAYQSVGPRDDGRPVGGRSLVESSVELRWRFAHQIGVVAFLDGGSSYEPQISDFRETYQWGTGIGFRYYTAIGPIRADVGFPLNPRAGIDHAAEFYISIGQAF